MDIATLLGIISGFSLVLIAINMGGGVLWFYNVPSIMIVVGGTAAITLINYPLSDVLSVMKVLKNAFLYQIPKPTSIVPQIVELSKIARREGILALEKKVKQMNEPFLGKGVELAVDGVEPDSIRGILENELIFTEERHKKGAEIFTVMGTFAPAMGMIGTLIGLVQMLMKMDDPKAIGPAMAVALITTFYGSIMANLLFLPIAGKLKLRREDEVKYKQLIIEGIASIQVGDNPRVVEQKLHTYLSPKEQVLLPKK
ncbi:MAG: flagellar motor protein MotP [Deltaproteobacteria bacterium DG_8]|nr:MAG: flagellar motor protein MotP [Deltaproteobacteria bacterium DG_8]